MPPAPASADAVLAALDPEQRAVAQALNGPVCVLAGAGTGKTRAITHRIAYGVHAGVFTPQTVLAVTFTARAAGEMRGRLRALGVGGVQARTFHAAALRQLRYFWPRVVGGEVPRITDRKVPLLAEAAGRLRLAPGPTGLRDLAAEVEWAKVTRTAPEDYAAAAARARRTPPLDLDAATMGRVFAGYEETKRSKGFIDFEDVLLLTVAALEDRRDVAEEVRGAYRHFVVDEYQDVNPLQQRLLELWLGDRDTLCVVGDASQTIYSFTGASSSYLLDFPRRWPGAEVVRLVRDYRSTPQVVDLANRVLGAARGPSAAARLELVAQRPPGPAPEFTGHPDEPAEAAGVAATIQGLLSKGVPASEVAVLFRINAQSEAYEDALTALGIPYVLRGGERFFERPEVKQAVLLMRGAARASEATGALLPVEVGDVLAATGWDPATPPTGGAARERWESLAALVRLAEDFASVRPDATLSALVAELTSAPPPSTHPPSRASPSPRCTRPRAWSGTPSSWSVWSTGWSRSCTPRRLRPSRRNAACSTWASPEPASTCPCPGRGRATRGVPHPQALPVPRRPSSGRGRRHRRSPYGRWARGQGTRSGPDRPELPDLRSAPDDRGAAQARPVRRLPAGLRRGLLRPAQGLAAGPLQGRLGARLCRLHRRDARSDRRTSSDDARRAGADQRGRCDQLERYSDQVLALVGGADVDGALEVGPQPVVEGEPSDTAR